MRLNRLFLAVLLLGTASFASAGSTPESQALALYTAIHKQNWKALYYLAAFSPTIKKSLPTPDKFASDVQMGIDQGGNAKVVKDLFDSMKNIRVGKAKITGNKASVPTSADLTVGGTTKHFVGVANMIKEGKVWKWDLSYTNNVEQATSESLQKLIGAPKG
jgi:hypothetical protein